MLRCSRPRALHRGLLAVALVIVGIGAPASLVVAADGSAASSVVPGPPPTCIPETEPNDQPETALTLSGAVCLTGTLPEVRDQDLALWEIQPADGLLTWRVTVTGIPTTITSVHIFEIRSDPGVTPVDAYEIMRVDSDATSDTPGVQTGISLAAGEYLLGISRGDPATGPPAPAGEYRVVVEPEQSLPAVGDVEPNDDATTATPISNPISLTGVVDGPVDIYRWTIGPDDGASSWQLDLRGIVGDYLQVRLLDASGEALASVDMQSDGGAHLYDLRLDPGDYLIELAANGDRAIPYVLSSQPSPDTRADAEPNDDPARAQPMAIGEERTGRLTGPQDLDTYRFTVPSSAVATQTDIRLAFDSAAERQLCLDRADAQEVQCRQGADGLELSNLLLPGGDYVIRVSGDEDLTDHYRLAVADVGLVVGDREVEPNDTAQDASPFDPALVMRGRSVDNDVDYFRLAITGERQVWRMDASGAGIVSLLWLEPDGQVQGTADVALDEASASLWDMDLEPGEHWIAIETQGGDYTIQMTPLGPRPPGSEHESNNDPANAELLDIGQPRTGRLAGPADTDVFRFSLEAPEHVVLRLDPPVDGGVKVQLTASGVELMRLREPAIGQSFVYDASLPIGDYEVTLGTNTGSIQPYTLLLDRSDPFLLPTDLEPNDVLPDSHDVPPTLHIEGTGWGVTNEDDDWYRLTAIPDPAQPLTVSVTGPATRMELTDGTTSVTMDPDETGTTWISRELPASAPLYLHVTTGGPYSLDVGGAGLVAQPERSTVPLDLSLTTDATEVAAYELFGQRINGTLGLTNAGSEPLDLAVEAATSDTRWSVALGQDTIVVPAGGHVEVPLTIAVPPDAWADAPTRITLHGVSPDGRAGTTSVDITPGRDTAPVGAEQVWPVPAALLGGMDAASLGLGASVVSPTFGEESEEALHDGLAIAGIGFLGSIADEPVTLTVDLATDDLVPVRGIIIDPLAGSATLDAMPRLFDLLLSEDGTTWDVVLSGELSPRLEDQAFVLDAPVPARFAQLRIRSTWTGTRNNLQIGEWQVIATPGWAPPGPINVAAPVLGGHVVSTDPGLSDPSQALGLLDEEQEANPWLPFIEAGQPVSWVVGFLDGRAAQVTELQWADPAVTDPAQRLDQVHVQVSTETPLGPWQDVGTWQLTRAADGSVAPFHFAEPVWARYVRISGDGPTERGYRETPTTIRVIERATDEAYRSITGAWGRNAPGAIHELLDPPDLSAVSTPEVLPDGNDTPETATALDVDVSQDAYVQRGRDIDWYQLAIPIGQNTLDLAISAPAAAGLVPTLQDADGNPVEMAEGLMSDPRTAHYLADVTPGATYRVLIQQPPFSTVFTYDTSGSMDAYLSYVSTALRGFAASIEPGEEVVKIIPFEDDPLLPDWSDDAYAIENAITGVQGASGSSAAETALIAALRELETRSGTRALLMVTDAETSSYSQMSDLWSELAAARALLFTVHVAGGGEPQLTTNLMQDWAYSWGGHYEYAASHGQLDRAFDRLATWLRRPAPYTIGYNTSFVPRDPGSLIISPPAGPNGDQSVVAGSGVAVDNLLDTSGSMTRKIGKRARIDIAKSVLKDLVDDTLPAGLPVALRIFDPKRSCGSKLLAPLGPLDKTAMTDMVQRLKIAKGTKTPLASTLSEVAGDLGEADGTRIIVLVTDGQESCKGDPEQAIRDLVAQGLDVRVNIVGFAIDDEGLKTQLQQWAEAGHGQAFDAQGAKDLAAGIAKALRAPFRVYDDTGQVVATGVVGGDPVVLPPGTYRVEVLSDPVIVLDPVTITSRESQTIQLEAPATP